jgi:4-diphosphocytidyl-2-C-methyl-D-erythritol kinase
MLVFPNAKINLGLRITEKRTDGYHNIETVFVPIPLKDALEFVTKTEGETSFRSEGLKLDAAPEQNLVMKAYQLLANDFALPALDIFLLKTIPFGAGLGGGSADAAFMLNALNDAFNLNLNHSILKSYAAKIGADCSFFINNKTAYAVEKGEVLEDFELDLKGYHIVLVKPEIFVSTPQAYSSVKPQKCETDLRDLLRLPVSQWKDTVVNDFEASIFKLFPQIGKIKEELYSMGAVYASMSGSGSSVFGLFSDAIETAGLFEDCFVWSSAF